MDESIKTGGQALDWNSPIEDDGAGYTILPEGDYLFHVTGYERARYPGSAKLDPCNKAVVTTEVEYMGGTVTVKFDLILHRSLEWKITSFFRSIGLKKAGQRMVMDWDAVPGGKGRCHIRPRPYTDSSGISRQANDITRFYDYDPSDWNEPAWLRDALQAPLESARPGA